MAQLVPNQDEILSFSERIRDEFEYLSKADNAVAKVAKWITGYDFPKNWCELAAIVLARQVARTFEVSDVSICHGYSEEYGNHFWVRVLDAYEIDITLDQFDFTNKPVLCYSPGDGMHAQHFGKIWPDPLVLRKLNSPAFEMVLLKLDIEITSRLQDDRVMLAFERYLDSES